MIATTHSPAILALQRHLLSRCRAERAIPAGTQVLHTYGDLADAQLVQTYGFVDITPQLPRHEEQQEEQSAGQQQQLSANPHNYVLLPVKVLLDSVKTVAAAAKIWPAKKTKQVGGGCIVWVAMCTESTHRNQHRTMPACSRAGH